MSCENVVSKNHGNRVISNELFADDKCLCKSIRAWLYSVSKRYAELMTVTKKLLETWGILWSGNDQDITDPCVHKNGHWIVDHWFIINWKQLLGCDHSQWVKSGTGSTG